MASSPSGGRSVQFERVVPGMGRSKNGPLRQYRLTRDAEAWYLRQSADKTGVICLFLPKSAGIGSFSSCKWRFTVLCDRVTYASAWNRFDGPMSDTLAAQFSERRDAYRASAARSGWYVHGARGLRLDAKLTVTRLAVLADVSRDSVSNVESSRPVTELVARKIFDTLNEQLEKKLVRADHVKPTPP